MKKTIAIFLFLFFVLAVSTVKAQVSAVSNPLNLENVMTVPSKVYVGSDFVLTGTVRNIADRYLYYVRLTVQGGFPFSKSSPLSSFYIGNLASNQTFQFSIPLTIDNDATNQQYTLTMKANYAVYDPAVTKSSYSISSETMTATVKVDKGVDIEIVNVSFPQQIAPDMKNGEITVYLQNFGINTAKEVELNLAAQYPFTPSGKSYFIDEIKPGETKLAIFHVDVDSAASVQTYPLDMTINWKEGNNQYSDTKTFGIPVEKNNLPSSLSSLLKVSNLIALVLIVAVLGIIVFIFKIRRKKKRK